MYHADIQVLSFKHSDVFYYSLTEEAGDFDLDGDLHKIHKQIS